MKPYERKQLKERIERESATVGASIPETIDVQGEEIALQEFIFETKRRNTIPPDDRERVDQLKKNLRRERRQRVQRVEDGDIDYETGERLVESIIGIDRALSALEGLEPVDIEQEIATKEAADRKRWSNFLKRALGKEDSGARGRR
ncbi:DUF5788 family protein [Halocatena pleomorpha]|uniref:Uncharacterized protein n=1 Tax=Halocatena pleomorpha TaxID=1785090 RepID=A0A3P3R8L1_9EURY|nr:DUF5788 family protein [Halocatena pleomorpha]RRJ28873.1 hypothetical protein EIK79_14240 [Halocatena pleomorpha]